MGLTRVPTLDDLAHDPARARVLPPEVARDLLLQLAPLQEALRLQALQPPASANGQPEVKGNGGDRLLTVKRAAEKLGCSTDYLYRNKDRLLFTVRQGRRVRFSEQGIERYIRQRMGREARL